MSKIKGIIRRAFHIIAYVVVCALLVVCALVLISNASGNVTFIAGRTTMWVKTDSMEPQIPERSYILVRQQDIAEIEVGDVIVFKSDDPSLGGAYNTHRVEEIVGDHREFVTKGDNNYVADRFTAKAANVVGVYERNLPVLTIFGRFMSTGMGVMLVVLLIFVIMAAVYLPDVIRFNREHTAELKQKKQDQIDQRIREEVERMRAENADKPLDPPDSE